MKSIAIFRICVLASIVGLTAMTAVAADLKVVVENLKNAEGSVRVGLFNNASVFPKSPMLGQTTEAKAGEVVVTFNDLAPGLYAVSTYQDINGNQKLDTNFVGLPTEPYGFSGGARGTFGPPSFNDARLEFGAANQTINIRLK